MGSIAIPITGSGNFIDSKIIGFAASDRVSPVFIDLNPTAAQISPAVTLSIGFCLLACILYKRVIRSFFPVLALKTVSPAFNTPEYTRIYANRPTKGSVAILNANAANGSESFGSRVNSFVSSTFVPVTAPISNGLGKYAVTESNNR